MEMKIYLTLRTTDGNYLLASDSELMVGGGLSNPAAIFEVVELSDGKVAFRSIINGRFLGVTDEGIRFTSLSVQPGNLFEVANKGQSSVVSLKTAANQFLAIDKDGGRISISPAEGMENNFFFMENANNIIEGLAKYRNPSGGKVQWGDDGHRFLYTSAYEVVTNQVQYHPDLRKFAVFLNEWSDTIRQGLFDADHKDPYRDWPSWSPTAIYRNHFYDPVTEQNYAFQTDFTAKTECIKYFNEAVARTNMAEKAYYFGLAFHFVSDLTMPMHTGCLIEDVWGRHSNYEGLADKHYYDYLGNMSAFTRGHIEPDKELASFLRHEVAQTSLSIYKVYVEPNLPWFGRWTKELADSSFRQLFGKEAVPQVGLCWSIRMGAKFMMYFQKTGGF